jgi:hypothetical protein
MGAYPKLGDKAKKNTNEEEKKKFEENNQNLVASLDVLHDGRKTYG